MFRPRRRALALLLSIGMLLASRSAAAAILYVNAATKAGAAQDGGSWKTAFASLQDALDAAAATAGPDEIWIAAGTYIPSAVYAPSSEAHPEGVPGGRMGTPDPRLKTFNLPDQVSIYGGFAGDERSRSRRAPDRYQTILSGGGESWHVVTAGNDLRQTGVRATLDGLTITGGNAGGTGGDLLFAPFQFNHDNGGGLYIAFESIVEVRNVTFRDNSAAGDGGGLFSINSTLHITGSRFVHNSAGLRGGALEVLNTYERAPHVATIDTTDFIENSVGVFGGAIVGEGTLPNEGSSMDINDCTFVGNTALEGGAIVFDSQTSTVRNSKFNRNIATVNAGALATTNVVDTIVNAFVSGPGAPFPRFATRVSNCEFIGNMTLGDRAAHDAVFGGPAGGINFAFGGGALVTYMNGYMDVADSTFRDNVVLDGDGGAILNGGAEAQNVFFTGADAFEVRTTVSNSKFIGNITPGNGGAIASMPGLLFVIPARTVAHTGLSVTGSIFAKNSAQGSGGAIYLDRSTATIGSNAYGGNRASRGASLYGVGSIVNGDSTSPISQ